MYLDEIKMDFGEFDMMLFLFLKLEKKVVKTKVLNKEIV